MDVLKYTMNSFYSVVLMTGNYSHDIATAFLAVSGITMWLISKGYLASANQSDDMELLFIRVYQSIRKIARYSLEWILIAGVPRIIFYKQFEWSHMAGNLQVVAIVIKHIVMFLIVGMGLYYWVKLNKKVNSLKIKHQIA
jgi:hypothetical protein